MVQFFRSALGVNDSARLGTTVPSGVTAASVSNTALVIIRPGADSADSVGLSPSTSASSP